MNRTVQSSTDMGLTGGGGVRQGLGQVRLSLAEIRTSFRGSSQGITRGNASLQQWVIDKPAQRHEWHDYLD